MSIQFIGQLLTQALVYALPLVITIAIAFAVKQWGNLVKSQKYGKLLEILEQYAEIAIQAANQLGNSLGWDNETRKVYVEQFLFSVVDKVAPGVFSQDEINKIVEAVIEGKYFQLKSLKPEWGGVSSAPKTETTPVSVSIGVGAEVAPPSPDNTL